MSLATLLGIVIKSWIPNNSESVTIGFLIVALVNCALQWLQKTIPMSYSISVIQVLAIPDVKSSG